MTNPGTLRQFEAAWRERTLADNPDLTRAEYDACYPAGSRRHEWIVAVEAFARDGGTLTRFEADSLSAEGVPVLRFLRYWPAALPEGYMTPDVRQQNKDYERSMIDARQRGREAFNAS